MEKELKGVILALDEVNEALKEQLTLKNGKPSIKNRAWVDFFDATLMELIETRATLAKATPTAPIDWEFVSVCAKKTRKLLER